jgi:coproporphyrinogen III oxidase
MDLDSQQSSFATYLGALQERITQASSRSTDPPRFRNDRWERPGGGGGNTRVLEGGAVFEKAAVNVSDVHGDLDPRSRRAARRAKGGLSVRPASSLVLHPGAPRSRRSTRTSG